VLVFFFNKNKKARKNTASHNYMYGIFVLYIFSVKYFLCRLYMFVVVTLLCKTSKGTSWHNATVISNSHTLSHELTYTIWCSILDQQQKQAIPFQGGVLLGDYDGRIFIASAKEVYSLVPIAWEKQVGITISVHWLFSIPLCWSFNYYTL